VRSNKIHLLQVFSLRSWVKLVNSSSDGPRASGPTSRRRPQFEIVPSAPWIAFSGIIVFTRIVLASPPQGLPQRKAVVLLRFERVLARSLSGLSPENRPPRTQGLLRPGGLRARFFVILAFKDEHAPEPALVQSPFAPPVRFPPRSSSFFSNPVFRSSSFWPNNSRRRLNNVPLSRDCCSGPLLTPFEPRRFSPQKNLPI